LQDLFLMHLRVSHQSLTQPTSLPPLPILAAIGPNEHCAKLGNRDVDNDAANMARDHDRCS